MSYVMNKGYHNTVVKKAVSCNLIEKIIEAKNNLLSNLSTNNEEYYNQYSKKYFDMLEIGNIEETTIGNCVLFLLSHDDDENYIERDINIYTSEMYCDAACYDELKYVGITKLPNNVDIIGFTVFSEECSFHIFQILYFNGEKLQIFTPYEGNAVNIITKTALGNESYCYFDKINKESALYSIIFPNGIDDNGYFEEDFDFYDEDEEEEYCLEKQDDVIYRYLSHFGATVKITDDFNYTLVPKNINAEVENVLM